MLSAYILWLSAQVPAELPVRWTAPAECPDRAALLASVSRRLGRPLADEATVDGRVTGDRVRGYTLHLELAAGGRGEVRDVQDPSCAALAEAAALRVVAAIEAPVIPPAPEPEPDPEPEPAPAPAPTPGPEAAVVPAERVRTVALPPTPKPVPEDRYDGPGAVVRVQGGLEVGALTRPGSPAPTGAVGLAVGLLWPRLRVEAQATVLPPRSLGDVQAGLYAGAVHGCGRVGRGALEVPLCGGVEVGAMRGRAIDLPGATTRTQVWVAGVLGPGLAWHARPRLSVWASLQLVLGVARPAFVQGDGDAARVLLQPAVASGRLLLGVELRLRDRW